MQENKILLKNYVYPIIILTKCFTDMFNNPNSYVEMNPSMHIDRNGNVKILVRTINYKKFNNGSFVVFELISDSIYYQLSGKIDGKVLLDIDNYKISEVTRENELTTYFAYWSGMEDIRFIDSDSILVTIPEYNEKGNPCIFYAKIEESIVHSFQECKPNAIVEKNWMPFFDKDGEPLVIYSLNPFLIKKVKEDIFTEINISTDELKLLENYHGSTNGIPYSNNEYLFLIHINKNITYHRWLIFNIETSQIRVSGTFVFFRHSFIEFPVSLCKFNERIFISLGVNDEKAFIIETDFMKINDHFLE